MINKCALCEKEIILTTNEMQLIADGEIAMKKHCNDCMELIHSSTDPYDISTEYFSDVDGE